MEISNSQPLRARPVHVTRAASLEKLVVITG